MIVDEITFLLGMHMDPQTHPRIARFEATLTAVASRMFTGSALLMGIASGLLLWTSRSSSSGAGIERFHQLTGMSVGSVQKWQYAATMVSGGKEAITRDIQFLTQSLNPVLPQQFNQGLFMLFGDKLRSIKSAEQALEMMNQVFPKLTEQKALQWGALIGISPETVLVLRQDLGKFFSTARPRFLTEKETEAALRFARVWEDLKHRFTLFSEHLAIKLLPLIERLVTALERWADQRWEQAQKRVGLFFDGLQTAFEQFSERMLALRKLAPVMGTLFDLFTDPKLVSGAVEAAMIGVGIVTALLVGKYVLIGLAVMTALGLAEDVFTGLSDPTRDSLTGRILHKLRIGPDVKGKREKSLVMQHVPEVLDILKKSARKAVTPRSAHASIPPSIYNQRNIKLYINNVDDPDALAKELEYKLKLQHRRRTGSFGKPLNPNAYDEIIQAAAQRYGVSAGLIKAVITQESQFDPHAVSAVGARGLMQLMPGTARGMGVTNAFDPYQNIMGGTKYLRILLEKFEGNLDLSLAAYNWGEGRVMKYGLLKMPKETRIYVSSVKKYYQAYGD